MELSVERVKLLDLVKVYFGSDGEMKPHEASNQLSKSVRERVRYSKLHTTHPIL